MPAPCPSRPSSPFAAPATTAARRTSRRSSRSCGSCGPDPQRRHRARWRRPKGVPVELDVMCTGGDLRGVQRFATAVAAAGLSGMVVTEGARTGYLTTAAASLAAPELHLATGVALAFPRSPMITAQTAWELAELTGGRFRLGL